MGDYLGLNFASQASLGDFPQLPEDCHAFTVTFWVKPLLPDAPFSCRLMLAGPGTEFMPFFADKSLLLHLMSFGDAPAEYIHLGGWRYFRQTKPSFTTRYPEQGPLDDSFFMTSVTNPKPSSWRFIAWELDFKSQTAKTFWDGRLASVIDLKETLSFTLLTVVDEPAQSFPKVTPAMFSGAKFFVDTLADNKDPLRHAWGNKVGAKGVIKSKIAQLRVYPKALSENQLLDIQARSVWSPQAQDPVQENTMTERGPQNATFDQAMAACALQDKSLATAGSPQAISDLIERAGSDLQSLSWVGAERDANGKWRWPKDLGRLSEMDFYEGHFTCHNSNPGKTLAEAQQVCRDEGRELIFPENHQAATLARIEVFHDIYSIIIS